MYVKNTEISYVLILEMTLINFNSFSSLPPKEKSSMIYIEL